MLSREQYTAQRTLKRMTQRGEPMVLRSVSLLTGPVPFKNPPDVSDDLVVTAAAFIGGVSYLNVEGTSVLGRLVPGDQVICTPSSGPVTTWLVLTMPATVLTNTDGIPQVDGSGHPMFGSPPVYNVDTLGWDDAFPVVAVSFVSGPVMKNISLALTNRSSQVLTLAAGGFSAAHIQASDVIELAGVVAPNTALNGVPLTVTGLTDTTLSTTGMPGGLTNGPLGIVTLTVTGGPDDLVVSTVGDAVTFDFAADNTVYGMSLSYEQMVRMGWVEIDQIGISIAALDLPAMPKVNDQILINAGGGQEKRAILQVGRRYRNAVDFLYPLRCQ